MNGGKICIRNQERILEFLESDDAELRDEQFFAHLEHCEVCRKRFENAAASKEYWLEAEKMLQTEEFDEVSRFELAVAGKTLGSIDKHLAVQRVLDSLAPTDDPHSLGRIGLYEITGVIGVGGMGVVLKASDPSLDRVVAIKLLAPHFANNSTARLRFSREARAAAAVLHPNVIPIHSVEESSELPFLVMAYIRGGSLQSRLDQDEPLKLEEILRIGIQVAAGLAAAHEQGLVHRDIKPENILLEGDLERVTITDFGLARAVDDNSVTQLGTIAGTPQYMSPEQARGEVVCQKSDLFSLGSVLYTMCTGFPPFNAETSLGVMRKIIDDPVEPIGRHNPEIPDWFASMIQKLLAKELSQRFESADVVKGLLEQCLKHIQQPEEKKVPSELVNLSLLEKEQSSSLLRTQRNRVLRFLAMLTIAALAGWSWYSGMLTPFFADRDPNTPPQLVNSAGADKTANNVSLRDSTGKTQTAEYEKLSFDLSHLPSEFVELAGFRPGRLDETELILVCDSILNQDFFPKWITSANVEQILSFKLNKEDKSYISLVKTTNSTAEFLQDTFGIDANQADGRPLMVGDNDVDSCVKLMGDHIFVFGAKPVLTRYSERQTSTDGASKILEITKNLRDGAFFFAIDSKSLNYYFERNRKKGTVAGSGTSSKKAAYQFLKTIGASTQFLAASVDYQENINTQISFYAVDKQGRDSFREAIIALKNILILSIPKNVKAGSLDDKTASAILSAMESLKVENGMELETRLDVEIARDLLPFMSQKPQFNLPPMK